MLKPLKPKEPTQYLDEEKVQLAIERCDNYTKMSVPLGTTDIYLEAEGGDSWDDPEIIVIFYQYLPDRENPNYKEDCEAYLKATEQYNLDMEEWRKFEKNKREERERKKEERRIAAEEKAKAAEKAEYERLKKIYG